MGNTNGTDAQNWEIAAKQENYEATPRIVWSMKNDPWTDDQSDQLFEFLRKGRSRRIVQTFIFGLSPAHTPHEREIVKHILLWLEEHEVTETWSGTDWEIVMNGTTSLVDGILKNRPKPTMWNEFNEFVNNEMRVMKVKNEK